MWLSRRKSVLLNLGDDGGGRHNFRLTWSKRAVTACDRESFWGVLGALRYRLNQVMELSNQERLWPICCLFSERGSFVLAPDSVHCKHLEPRANRNSNHRRLIKQIMWIQLATLGLDRKTGTAEHISICLHLFKNTKNFYDSWNGNIYLGKWRP